MRRFALLAMGTTIVGCEESLRNTAIERAQTELGCTDLGVQRRPDLSEETYEVRGCGKKIRYTCRFDRQGFGIDARVLTGPLPHIEVTPE